jgi:hypothetical protein
MIINFSRFSYPHIASSFEQNPQVSGKGAKTLSDKNFSLHILCELRGSAREKIISAE